MCSDDTVQAIVRGVSPDGEYEDEHELHSIIMTGSNRLGRDNLQIVCMSKTIEVIGIWKAGWIIDVDRRSLHWKENKTRCRPNGT